MLLSDGLNLGLTRRHNKVWNLQRTAAVSRSGVEIMEIKGRRETNTMADSYPRLCRAV